MGCVKRHGNGSYGNSRRISMRKLYKEGNDNTRELLVL